MDCMGTHLVYIHIEYLSLGFLVFLNEALASWVGSGGDFFPHD